jgi:hypothetical protein
LSLVAKKSEIETMGSTQSCHISSEASGKHFGKNIKQAKLQFFIAEVAN